MAKYTGRLSVPGIEVVSVAASPLNRINEDAWLALEFSEYPGYLVAAVIDGAGERLPLPPLKAALEQHHHSLSPAAFAATCVRNSLISQFADQPDRALPEALLIANKTLRTAIANIVGEFSPSHILELANLPPDADPRRARLALPACVATLVRLNYAGQKLEYAHAGDTSLLEIRRDADVILHTRDQMDPHDRATLRLADQLRRMKGLRHIAEAVALPEVRQMNIENGLRHNFVDAEGFTHPGDGCGVLNGLPELADYIESGTLPVNSEETDGFCLLSDGLELLAPLDETAAEKDARLRRMGALLRTRGVQGLLEAVREMTELDIHHDQYPRIKTQDDATGVYLRISGLYNTRTWV